MDTGGTFTDLVALEDGEIRVEKLPSTPADPSRAVLAGVERLGGAGPRDEVVHGTTVALNALLTRRVARTALVTNEGFQDLVEIGRQARPELYAEHPEKAEPLVPRRLRFEVPQRSWPGADGALEEGRRPTRRELDALRQRLRKARPESIAVCLLHAYADPRIEREVADALAPLGVPITCSAELLREYREFERFSTACANAALAPLVADYLENLAAALPGARLSILQSSGGALSAARAATEPARVLLSGPAGGVVGAARAAREAGIEQLVTLDMGGTSTDVAFHEAGSRLEDAVSSAEVDGLPIGLPSLDIHTIGCGGGSIVRLVEGGVLHVGPRSAGADQGPACHGRGGPLTVTDAHLALGHLAPGRFLAGSFELDEGAVARGFEDLGRRLGVRPREAALAVLEVARAAMRRAVGGMTMQRGHDPERLPLVAFGGAGGLQAAALAGGLGLPGALVPALPGCLSARGMASADALADRSLTLLAPLAAWPARARRAEARALAEGAITELREAGHARRAIETEFRLDLRYRGQAYELAVPESFDARVLEAFTERHRALYGWALDDGEVELVHLRARAAVRRPLELGRRPRRRRLPADAVIGERRVELGGSTRAPVIDRSQLAPGMRLEGPGLIEEFSGTTLLPPGWSVEVTRGGHLWLSSARS